MNPTLRPLAQLGPINRSTVRCEIRGAAFLATDLGLGDAVRPPKFSIRKILGLKPKPTVIHQWIDAILRIAADSARHAQQHDAHVTAEQFTAHAGSEYADKVSRICGGFDAVEQALIVEKLKRCGDRVVDDLVQDFYGNLLAAATLSVGLALIDVIRESAFGPAVDPDIVDVMRARTGFGGTPHYSVS